jgi:hypothetical protein
MSSDNPTADRLVGDARKKTASLESPRLAQIALGIGIVGLIGALLSPLAGWILGAIAAGMGTASIKRGIAVKIAKIALILGVLAILGATFNFCWATAIS